MAARAEVGAIARVGLTAHQAQQRLMHPGGGIHGLRAGLAPPGRAAAHVAQRGVKPRNEPLERRAVAAAPPFQQFRDLA